jgi:spermidine synthase
VVFRAAGPQSDHGEVVGAHDADISRARCILLLACIFLSGAAGLIYQVAWGNALGLVFGDTVYAISTVLAVFLSGLALGSAWWGRASDRLANPVLVYGCMEIGVAASGALSLAGPARAARGN